MLQKIECTKANCDSGTVPCGWCDGTGAERRDATRACTTCKGAGYESCATCEGRGHSFIRVSSISDWMDEHIFDEPGDPVTAETECAVSVAQLQQWVALQKYNSLSEAQRETLDAIAMMDCPGTVRDVANGIKQHLGKTVKPNVVEHRCRRLAEEGLLKLWPGNKNRLKVYGLPHHELAEGTERERIYSSKFGSVVLEQAR